MCKDFASIHIIGSDKEKVVSLICPSQEEPYIVRDLTPDEEKKLSHLRQVLGNDFIASFKKKSFEFVYLDQPYIGIQNENAYSVFSPVFEMTSLEGRISLCFDYQGAPSVVGFCTDFESVIRIFLYKDKKITSNMCFCVDKKNAPPAMDVDDYDFGYSYLEGFEEIFGFSSEELKEIINKYSSFDELCEALGSLFRLPFNVTYDELATDTKKYNAETIH